MGRPLTSAERPGFKTLLVHRIFQNFSVHPAALNEYPTRLRAGKGEDEEWRPTSSYSIAGTSWLSSGHLSTGPLWTMGTAFTF